MYFIMKIFGYSNNTGAEILELCEATFMASPAQLREIASFLIRCAEGMESQGNAWNHEHFASSDQEIVRNGPEIVVFNPEGE